MVLLSAGYQAFPTVIGTAYTLNYDIQTYNITPPEEARGFLGTALGLDDVATQVITGITSFALPFTATSAVTFAQFETSGGFDAEIDVDNVSCVQETFQTLQAGGLSQLIVGIAANHELTRVFLETLTHIRDPYKTFILDTLEREHGISPDTMISDTDRRDKLAAVKFAKASTGSLSAMQTALDRAFPDLFTVYDNDPPQDPAKFITPEILADADMESASTASWTVGNSATITKEIVSPIEGVRNLKVARDGVNNPYAFQLVIITGGVYNISGWGRGDGSASPKVWLGTNSVWTGTSSTDWQFFNVQGETAAGASFGVRLEATTSTGTQFAEFDDFHLSQTQIGRTIVNGRIYNSFVNYFGSCGEIAAQCGEDRMQCGDNKGIIKTLNSYPIPNDSQYWTLIFFVGGAATFAPSSGNQMECGEALSQCGEPYAQCGSFRGQITSIVEVEVPIERRNDLERLILALKPMHSWGLLFAVYQLVLNGDFDDDSTWTLGTGWAIAGGECTHTPGTGSSISQLNRGVIAGFSYRITFTLSTVVAGSIQPFVGSTGAGTARTASGTYTEVITAAGTDSIAWTCNAAFDGIVDDVSVVEL